MQMIKVENEEIEFRKATIYDNLEEISSLIYDTDPYIYPFWFNNDIEEAKKFLPNLLRSNNNLFNINNFYIAYDKSSKRIIGILCAIDKSINFDYDYTDVKNINSHYDFTINNYVVPIEKEMNDFDENTIYISNICIDKNYRGKRIGSFLIGYFISQMERQGYDKFYLDCLLHNLRAKNLYHCMGFREIKEIVGFDGTNESKVEVVSFLRKKGDYYPSEFQVSFLDK